MRTIALTLSMLAGLCFAASDAAAQDAGNFQLLGTVKVDAGSPSLRVVPVAIGAGWRGWGWYPSASRPVSPYQGTANATYGLGPSSVRGFTYYNRHAHGNVYRP